MEIRMEEIKLLAEAINNLADAVRTGNKVQGTTEAVPCTQENIPEFTGWIQDPATVTQQASSMPDPQTVEAYQTAVPPQNTAQAVPTSAVSYTMDDLAKAAITLMDSGRQTELQQLLGAFGVNSLPELPQEHYGAFATSLREKGAQI